MAKVQPSSIGEIMELLEKGASVMVLDTEPIFYPPPKKIFDFGYVITNSTGKTLNLTGTKRYNKLVYEALVDKEYMFAIRKWGKLTGAAEGSLYGFYNLMIENGYINTDTNAEDLERELVTIQGLALKEAGNIMKSSREDILRIEYEQLQRKRPGIMKTYSAWHEPGGSRYTWNPANANNAKAKENAEKYKKALEEAETRIITAMLSQSRLDKVAQDLTSAGLGQIARQLKSAVLQTAYEEQKMQYYRDIVKMPSLSDLKATLKIDDIDNWDSIMDKFFEDIEKNAVVGVTGYNVAADRQFVRNSNTAWSTSRKGQDIFESEEFQTFCLMSMYRQFYNAMNEEKVKDYALKNLGTSMEDAYKNAIIKGKNDFKFEIAYRTVFDKPGYKEKHTAIEDAMDETEFLAKLMEEILSKKLK